MSQSNKGVLAVLAAGCILGSAIGLGYAFVWAPKQRVEAARREIREWGVTWTKSKFCLIGRKPPSRDTTEALLARELSSLLANSDLAGCRSAIKQLTRQAGATTENEAIEKAWEALQSPLNKLKQAHLGKVVTAPEKPQAELTRSLAKAIDKVDAHYEALRDSANLAPSKNDANRLPIAETVMLLAAPAQQATYRNVLVRDGHIRYEVDTNLATFIAELNDDGETRFEQLSHLALRAVNARWGLWIERDGIPVAERESQEGDTLVAGPLDDLGDPAADGTVLYSLEHGESASLKFAVGDTYRYALSRHVVETDENTSWEYRMITSSDSGATWSRYELPDSELYVSLQRDSHGSHLSWQDVPTSSVLKYQELSSEGSELKSLDFARDRSAFASWPPEACHAPNRTWWVVGGYVYTALRADGELQAVAGTVAYDTENYDQIMRCSDEGFAVTSKLSIDEAIHGRISHQSCDTERCNERIGRVPSPEASSNFSFYHQGKHSIVVASSGVVALWVDGAHAPELFALKSDAAVKGALSRDGHVELLLWADLEAAPTIVKLR